MQQDPKKFNYLLSLFGRRSETHGTLPDYTIVKLEDDIKELVRKEFIDRELKKSFG